MFGRVYVLVYANVHNANAHVDVILLSPTNTRIDGLHTGGIQVTVYVW